MHQQLLGTKLSGKVSLGVREEKRLNTIGLDYLHFFDLASATIAI
jgi:hypothetical protein